jgi:DNA invertase Pin-like site-specific DNA recombinase
MHVIGYTRVSTLNQAEEGVSLAAQAEKSTAYTVSRIGRSPNSLRMPA